jgi:membrane protease subunit (stomatin/prohibitin family)
VAILDLIEHADERADEMVRRVPELGSGEFRLGSQLVVREGQRAVFFRDGKALDVFGPGRHTLSTNNIPFLTGLIGLPFGGDSPFKAEVFFVAMRELTDLKWGTLQPVVHRDSELGMVRLRAFGTYSFRVADPQLFVNTIVGSRGTYTTGAIDDFLKSIIINEFNDLLGTVQTSILDIQSTTGELAVTARNALVDDFSSRGLELISFQISAITPPEEVQQRIDERSGMGALGDMRAYTQYRTAQAIGDAANNPGAAGDVTSAGVGLGAGLGIGQAMAGAMRDAYTASEPAPESTASGAATMSCPNCQAAVLTTAKFCPNCGQDLQGVACPKCQTMNAANAKFCTNCGTNLEP